MRLTDRRTQIAATGACVLALAGVVLAGPARAADAQITPTDGRSALCGVTMGSDFDSVSEAAARFLENPVAAEGVAKDGGVLPVPADQAQASEGWQEYEEAVPVAPAEDGGRPPVPAEQAQAPEGSQYEETVPVDPAEDGGAAEGDVSACEG